LVGKITRRGTNYLICVTESGMMFKSWISDVTEYINEYKNTIKKKTKNSYIKNFINKYRKR